MRTLDSVLVRGAIAGIVGAAALAFWFLIVDTLAGEPLRTPAFLAGALGGSQSVDFSATSIAAYSVLHLAVFIGVGIATTWLVDRFGLPPHFLLGLVLGILLFDVLFYAGVIVTGVNVVRALGWPQVLAGNLIAGVALFGFLHATAPAAVRPSWDAGLLENRIMREGIIAGALGAATVALWFLALDLVQGRLWFTPAALGSALFLGAGSATEVQHTPTVIAAYTAVHLAGFIGVGLLAAALVRGAERHPPVILGAALLFVTMEAFIIGLIAIVAVWLFDVIAWWTIAAANIVAALAMGVYLWRSNPRLRAELGRHHDLEDPRLAGSGV
jgi:hypothetical protein